MKSGQEHVHIWSPLSLPSERGPAFLVVRLLYISRTVAIVQTSGVTSFVLLMTTEQSLAGVDLNRQWKRPSRSLHPTVFWLKQHIRQEQAKKGVAMYIDLHGHRRVNAALHLIALMGFPF